MESALYGIYALVFVSEILLVRCAHSFDFWYVNNSCVNTVRQHFPWSILYILLKTDEKRKKLPTTDRKNINRLPSNGPTLSIFVFIRKRFCIFSSLGSNHIKFTTCQMVQRKELPPLLIRLYSNRQPTSGLRMVADNCHSSKRHKFVNFRLNLNYFELKEKWNKTQHYFLFHWTGNRLFFHHYYFQIKTKHFYYEMKIKIKVK